MSFSSLSDCPTDTLFFHFGANAGSFPSVEIKTRIGKQYLETLGMQHIPFYVECQNNHDHPSQSKGVIAAVKQHYESDLSLIHI